MISSKTAVRRSRYRLPAMGLGLVLSSQIYGAEPHTHGLAHLQIAIEGHRVDLIFTSPAANLIGFEHAPKSEAQHKTLEDATRFLKDRALILDQDGTCALTEASVSSDLLNGRGRDMAEHPDASQVDHHEHHDEHPDEHVGHADNDGHDHEADEAPAHSDFTVSQHLDCSKELRGALRTPLLERFESIENLQVQWVDGFGQGSTSLTRGNARIRLRD